MNERSGTMNYIAKLKADVEAAETRIAVLEAGLREIAGYLTSPKFQADGDLRGYVNVRDVLTRIREVEDRSYSILFEMGAEG